MKKDFDAFFYARSLVIFGLSPSPANLARNVLANLRRWGYEGKVFGISPRAGENDGVKIYTSLDELPEKPELALILTRAELVPKILLDCAQKGIRHIAVTSAGFEETGKPEGKELAEQVKTICREKGLYLIGPNCIGTANRLNGLCLSFYPLDLPRRGKIAFISQSGGVGTSLSTLMSAEAFPLGKFVSVGNKTVLDEVDFLEYLVEDKETNIICFYLEDLRRGREFIELAKRSAKPVIVYMAGITPYGVESSRSHTGALRNDELVLRGAFRQANVVWAESLVDMLNIARAFQMPPMKGNRLLAVSPSGGLSVVLSDLAWREGFELPPLPKDLVQKYSQHRRAGVIEFKNPLDFGDLYSAELQHKFLLELLSRKEFDGMVMAYVHRDPEVRKLYPSLAQIQRDLVGEFNQLVERTQKPVGFVLISPYPSRPELYAQTVYPIYDRPEDAVRVLAVLRDWWKGREILRS